MILLLNLYHNNYHHFKINQYFHFFNYMLPKFFNFLIYKIALKFHLILKMYFS